MTNITEFLGAEALEAVAILGGYRAGGSDYERFRAFCRGAGRLPGSADAERVMRILRACFGCGLIPNAETCDAIWRSVADALFERGEAPMLPPEDRRAPTGCPALPVLPVSVTDCPPLCGARTWAEWRERTERALAGAEAVRVTLPAGFRAVAPSLWHAERILRGEMCDPAFAPAQQAIFLAEFCSPERRLCLATDCPPEEALRLLRIVHRKQGSLPPMIWDWSPAAAPDRAVLLAAAGLIDTPEGIPPVVTSRTV